MHIFESKPLKTDQNTSRRQRQQHANQRNATQRKHTSRLRWVHSSLGFRCSAGYVVFRCSFDSVFPLGFVVPLGSVGFPCSVGSVVALASAVPLGFNGSVGFRCSAGLLCCRCSFRINQSQPVTTATQQNAIQHNNSKRGGRRQRRKPVNPATEPLWLVRGRERSDF